MSSPLERSILNTVVYSDIFDYPLTLAEIGKWLIKLKIKNEKLKTTIKKFKLINGNGSYYFLKGRKIIVSLRKEREKYSKEKLKIVQQTTRFMRFIPSIKLIGITGALAVNNAKKDDDIDLIIITSKRLLWTTRLLVTLLIEITGMRRHPDDINVNNKICLNMFLDEGHLQVPKKEQDLFSAHEVMQMKLLWDKDKTYQKFLYANKWVGEYLPNAIKIKNAVKTPRGWQAERSEAMTPPMVEELAKSFFNILENFLKKFQLWYMRHRRTSEVIREGVIRFHPHDTREEVIKKYKMKRSSFNLPP